MLLMLENGQKVWSQGRHGPGGFVDNNIKRLAHFPISSLNWRTFASPQNLAHVFQIPKDIYNPSSCYSNIFGHSARHTTSSKLSLRAEARQRSNS